MNDENVDGANDYESETMNAAGNIGAHYYRGSNLNVAVPIYQMVDISSINLNVMGPSFDIVKRMAETQSRMAESHASLVRPSIKVFLFLKYR